MIVGGTSAMRQRYDQGQHPDAKDDAWSAAWGDLALQELGRRLESYDMPPEQAATVVEQVWLFYSYEALPLIGERVPMGIATRAGDRPVVWLYLPFRTDDGSIPQQSYRPFLNLNRIFAQRFEEPLAESVVMDLEPMAASLAANFADIWTMHRFENRVHESARHKNLDVVGVFIDNLIAELMTVMDHETVSRWLDAPNTLFGGRKPNELLDDPLDQQLRDVITRAKFNMSAA